MSFIIRQVINLGPEVRYGFQTKTGERNCAGLGRPCFYKNTLAGYHHLHVSTAPVWAEQMVSLARAYQQKQQENT